MTLPRPTAALNCFQQCLGIFFQAGPWVVTPDNEYHVALSHCLTDMVLHIGMCVMLRCLHAAVQVEPFCAQPPDSKPVLSLVADETGLLRHIFDRRLATFSLHWLNAVLRLLQHSTDHLDVEKTIASGIARQVYIVPSHQSSLFLVQLIGNIMKLPLIEKWSLKQVVHRMDRTQRADLLLMVNATWPEGRQGSTVDLLTTSLAFTALEI
mmetsp:Transcript_45676/g.106027  ORF Transcript_45676/g.106027 Transcript_45676/m.106027 type:complete len:209 (+) Transcript_45676:455-1081(+)